MLSLFLLGSWTKKISLTATLTFPLTTWGPGCIKGWVSNLVTSVVLDLEGQSKFIVIDTIVEDRRYGLSDQKYFV